MTTAKFVFGIGIVLVTLPIWLYLLYKILEAIQASELMWFLYWVYVAFSLVMGILGKVIQDEKS